MTGSLLRSTPASVAAASKSASVVTMVLGLTVYCAKLLRGPSQLVSIM